MLRPRLEADLLIEGVSRQNLSDSRCRDLREHMADLG
jgi:hypothetical protein